MGTAKKPPSAKPRSRGGRPPGRPPGQDRSNLPKVLRIGIIQGGKIIEERIVRRRETVTVGSSEKNHFILTAQEFPVPRFEMFETRGGPYVLNFDEKMSGRVSLEGEVVELAEARASGKARKKGKVYQLPLSDKSRGKVVIGETTILFQFVAPPPIRPRPQLPAAVRGGVFRSMDWFITTLWVVSFLLHGGIIFWWETTDWPKRDNWDKFMELQELIAADTDATFEKKKKAEVEEGEGDEEEVEDEGEVDDEPQERARPSKQAADTGPKKSAEEIARERAEKRAELAEKLAEKGINKILGTLGGEGADGAIADVLKGGDVGADQDDLLEQVDGVGVTTSEKGGSLKGPAGGKGGGEAANVDQVKVKGGDKTVKTEGPGQERKVKGKVRKKQPMSSGGTGMLKQSDVAKVVNRRLGAIKGCYERALKRDPTLQGKVTVQFTISGSGRVTNARATRCEVGAAVCSCITSSFKRFRFPPPEGGSVTFQMPFLFTPSG